MKFDLKNIGPIKEASIKVDGLTVIAGENSIGKSAIGKAIFCLVKSLTGSIERLENENLINLEDYSDNIYSLLRRYERRYNTKVRHLFSVNTILRKYENIENRFEGQQNLFQETNEDTFIDYINKIEEIVISKINIEVYRKDIQKQFKEIKSLINKPTNNEENLKIGFDYLIKNVFNKEISSKYTKNEKGTISFKDSINLMKVEIENNKTTSFKANEVVLDEVSIIESPLILSMYRFIRDNLAFNRRSFRKRNNYQGLPYYIFDIIRKISQSDFYDDDSHYEISKIISGKLHFDRKRDNFVYIDKNRRKHDIINVASGIKSFGLIQLLLSSGNLNKNTLLIIDEPEVHLHPFWQIEYAKVLVKLAENNIPVIVASHSPYFIEALKTYSDKTIKDKTNFYLGEMQEGGSVFKDVTDDLEPIFELLAIPMQQLMLDNN